MASTATRSPWHAMAFTAAIARAAATAVFRETSTSGRPQVGQMDGRSRVGRRTAPRSHDGCSSIASVVVPAPPCAPTTTISRAG